MKKEEFLRELRNALEGKLPEADIEEITSDYSDIFEHRSQEGKSEEEIAKEIGSPAKIVRTILEDGTVPVFEKPQNKMYIQELAPMSKRLGAYIIDNVLLGVIVVVLVLLILTPVAYMGFSSTEAKTEIVKEIQVNTGDMEGVVVDVNMNPSFSGGFPDDSVSVRVGSAEGFLSAFVFGKVLFLMFLLSGFNFLTAIFLWATNGYTPGKWLLKIRVVKMNGKKLSLLDALLRDVIIKCIANSMLSGLLNIGSFIWGCATEDHKTVHDLAAQTKVVEVRRADVQHVRNSNPLEI